MRRPQPRERSKPTPTYLPGQEKNAPEAETGEVVEPFKPKIVSAIEFDEPLPPDIAWWRHAAVECLRCPSRLSNRQSEFLAVMVEWEGRPSQKQIEWLMAIHARLYPVRATA
jgi:hypothetical protein